MEAIRESNLMLPTGGAKIGDLDDQIESNSMYDTPAAMEQIPLKARRGNAGYVGDVGRVKDVARIQTGLVRINGRRQVYVPAYRQQGASTLNVVERADAGLPSDTNRAQAEFDARRQQLELSDERIAVASVALAQPLMFDPATLLIPAETSVDPIPLIPTDWTHDMVCTAKSADVT